ncbi:3-keto-disaccharide hydrolase [Pontibacter liquoris]|uniref:3-keto-disaccharide hydrolase n=1 Tax=Pontibacter liquoris TaxID=2905677 RepID=UPI001FA7BF41|nr:DUF1080 domain-containing protein [Pontibacter liquoris]
MIQINKVTGLMLLLVAVLAVSACATKGGSATGKADNTLTKAEKAAGWVLLFDGTSLEHWRGFHKENAPAAWQVEDGAIALVGGQGGDIISKKEYENFELMLDWKISEGGNSGIFFHVSEDPKFKYTWQTGPEMQIIDDERHPDAKQGKNNNRQAGTNYDMHPLATPAVKPVGEYNTVRLVVKDGHVEQYLNGKKVVEYNLWSPEWEALVKGSKFASMPEYGQYKSGYIALQDHGDKVWFKNIKIRPL